MAEIELYSYAKCSTCRQAEAFLTAAGATVKKRDLFSERLDAGELRALFARIGISPRSAVATRSRPFAELGLAGRELSDDETIELMGQYPALIKRPVVVNGQRAVFGFNRSAIESLLTS
jgi:regulatory protein spx